MFRNLRPLSLVVLIALAGAVALSGCATPLKVRDQVTINSNPPGARVFVAGKEVGLTPVSLNLDERFPRHWTRRLPDEGDEIGFSTYRRLETVDLKKDGCEVFTREYRESELTRDIEVSLKCDPDYVPAPVDTTKPQSDESVEQRLRALEHLKQGGLITDEEYREQRKRILDTM